MKRVKNEKAFSRFEITIILLLFLVLIGIGAQSIHKNTKQAEFSTMKKIVDNFVYQANMYKDHYPKLNNTYYLYELIRKNFMEDIKNPFDQTQKCDRYESNVVVRGNDRRFLLKCGEYVIEGEAEDDYKIYKVGEWTRDHDGIDMESEILYNYEKDGKVMFDQYYVEREFLVKFNEKEGKKAMEIEVATGDGIKVLSEVFYREKKLVKDF